MRALTTASITLLLCSAALALGAGPALAVVTPSLNGTTLTLTGDGADDTLVLSAGATTLDVDLNGDGLVDTSFPLAGLAGVTVNAGGGNDAVAGPVTAAPPLTINGQDGADIIAGGTGPDTITGGEGPDLLTGGRGPDQLAGDGGADRFDWAPGDGSDTIEGGAAADLAVFTGANVAENMTLSASGSRALLTRDVANVQQDMGGVESLDVRMLGGVNTFVAGAGVAAVLPSVRVQGGPLADTLTGGDEADELIGAGGVDVVNAGAGDDTIPLGLPDGGDTIDAGPGTDTLAVTGSDASEHYTVGVPAVAAASVSEAVSGAVLSSLNTERVRIEALGGNDVVAMQDAAATAITADLRGGDGDDALTAGSGADILRGGAGADRLDAAGGNDQLSGDAGDDLLLGRAGADAFACGGLGDLLDATAEDSVAADCVPAPPAVVPPPATAADTTAPSLTLRGLPARITRAALLKRGVRFSATPGEASALDAELLVRARGATIAGAAPNLTLARRTLGRAAGARTITLKPARALLGRARRFTLTVRVAATDAAGNRRTLTRTVKVR